MCWNPSGMDSRGPTSAGRVCCRFCVLGQAAQSPWPPPQTRRTWNKSVGPQSLILAGILMTLFLFPCTPTLRFSQGKSHVHVLTRGTEEERGTSTTRLALAALRARSHTGHRTTAHHTSQGPSPRAESCPNLSLLTQQGFAKQVYGGEAM